MRACEKLEKELCALAKRALAMDEALKLRNNIMTTIASTDCSGARSGLLPVSLQKLCLQVRRTGQEVGLSENLKISLKEKILTYVEDWLLARGVCGGFFARNTVLKTMVSYFLLLVFITSSLFVFPFQIQVAHGRSTYVSELYGDVFVLRNMQLIKGRANFDLREGDVILTKDKSFVTINFLDDSLSRLGENTELKIQTLYAEPFNPVVTQVALFLKQGRIWTRVVNLIDKQSDFTVATKEAEAKVTKKAAFDLSVKQDEVKLAVFDNVVELVSPDHPDKSPTAVVAGFEVAVSPDTDLQVAVLSDDDVSSSLWVSSNLTRDRAYREKLIDDKEKLIHSGNEEQGFEAPESLQGNDAVLLADSQVQEATRAFLAAYRELKRGQTLLVRGGDVEGLRALKDFKRNASAIIRKLSSLERVDPFNTALLRKLIQEKVAIQLKNLAAFLPGQRLYVAKEILQQVEQILAADEVIRTQVRLSQAEGKLLEIQELIKGEKIGLAIIMMEGYERQASQLLLQMNDENLVEVVKHQAEQIKALAAVEQNIKNVPFDRQKSELLEKVQKARHESLKQLKVSLAKLPPGSAAKPIADLKDVLAVYLGAEQIVPVVLSAEELPAKRLLPAPPAQQESSVQLVQPEQPVSPAQLGSQSEAPVMLQEVKHVQQCGDDCGESVVKIDGSP